MTEEEIAAWFRNFFKAEDFMLDGTWELVSLSDLKEFADEVRRRTLLEKVTEIGQSLGGYG